MKNHVQVVAALHIAMGALFLLAGIAIFAFMGMAGAIVITQGETEAAGIIGIVSVAVGCFLTVLALPGIVAGWALLTGRSWGRVLALVLGALHLLNFPFGTALGIYTFWALLYEPQAALPSPAAAGSPAAI